MSDPAYDDETELQGALTPVEQTQAQAPAALDPEATISQVRSLLFGEAQQHTANRLNHLDDLLREFDRAARERMDAIERRIDEERARADSQRRNDLLAIGEALERLSRDVRRLADG